MLKIWKNMQNKYVCFTRRFELVHTFEKYVHTRKSLKICSHEQTFENMYTRANVL
jgi:hypothetical protein